MLCFFFFFSPTRVISRISPFAVHFFFFIEILYRGLHFSLGTRTLGHFFQFRECLRQKVGWILWLWTSQWFKFSFFIWIFKSDIFLLLVFINSTNINWIIVSLNIDLLGAWNILPSDSHFCFHAFLFLCRHSQTSPFLPRYSPSPTVFYSSVLKFWNFKEIIKLRPFIIGSTVAQFENENL